MLIRGRERERERERGPQEGRDGRKMRRRTEPKATGAGRGAWQKLFRMASTVIMSIIIYFYFLPAGRRTCVQEWKKGAVRTL